MKKLAPLIVIAVLILSAVTYHFYNKERDQHIANRIYEQMIVIDNRLDLLKESAEELHKQQDMNTQVIHGFNDLTKENFDEQKSGFADLVKQLTYDEKVESQLLKSISQTNSKNFKVNRKILKDDLQLLKYDYAQNVSNFNKQIADITAQVKDLNAQIATINSDNIQRLELARLKFISNKLSKTMTELTGSFWDKILDDVVEKDRISDKDSDGND